MKIERLVVGTDFSEGAAAAARWAASHLAAKEIVLVHCLRIPEPPAFLRRSLPPPELLLDAARASARQALADLRQSLDAPKVTMELREGEGLDELTTAAREHAADLIVVGQQGERSTTPRRLGRTAEHLARSSSVPVLVVPPGRHARPKSIVAALDDAPVTPAVLAWTRAFADLFHADVTAVHVVSSAVLSHVLSMASIAAGGGEPPPEQVQEEFRVDTSRWIRELVHEGLPPARVWSEVDFGEPGREIMAAAQRTHSGMVILGSRGAGRVRRALLGSVVREVLQLATCPVLVVTEPADDLA